MLGLADRTQLFDLYDDVLKGKAAEALRRLNSMHQAGADRGDRAAGHAGADALADPRQAHAGALSEPATPEAERAWGAKADAGSLGAGPGARSGRCC